MRLIVMCREISVRSKIDLYEANICARRAMLRELAYDIDYFMLE